MTDELWVIDAETTVFSRAKGIIVSTLKSVYPDIDVTESDCANEEAKFPTVYIHALQPYERGNDLENDGINAVDLTYQVEVYVTKAQNLEVARKVSSVVVNAFKSMRFNATMPEIQTNTPTGTLRSIMRFSRILGSNETI